MVEDFGRLKIALKDMRMEVVSSSTTHRFGLHDSAPNGFMTIASLRLRRR